MGLFSIFSNDDAEKAAAQKKAGLQQGYDALSTNYGSGRDAINTGAATATGYYQPLMQKYGAGTNAYGDATGVNGAAGQARARQNFQSDPGYGFQMDQGLQALQRTHAAAGNLNSGNADADTLKFSQGLADQSYGNYVNRLSPYFNAEAGAVGGAANVATGQGGAINQSYMGQGNAANANYTGQGNADAAATMNNYQISKNMWDGIGKVASIAAAPFSGGASLFGGFGGGGQTTANPYDSMPKVGGGW